MSSQPRDHSTLQVSFPDVRIVYEDASGDQTERKITPIHRSTSGIITAHCHLRNDERTFRFDRVRGVFDADTGKTLDKYEWVNSLPNTDSDDSRHDTHMEEVIRITVDIQPEGGHVSINDSRVLPPNVNIEERIAHDKLWPSDSVRGMVPKPGSFDASLFVDPNTGRFKFPNYRDNKKHLVEIRDNTDYRDQFWNHLDRQDKREYDLSRFNWDIESGGLIIEVEGFIDLFKPENRHNFPQFEMLFRVTFETLLDALETNHATSELDLLWVAPSDAAYKAVEDGYLVNCNRWKASKDA